MLLLLVPVGFIGMAVFMFFFTRTSAQVPSTLTQIKTEAQYQISGVVGVAQDIGLRHKNKISESTGVSLHRYYYLISLCNEHRLIFFKFCPRF